jgi:hypothetical protein
MDVKGQQISESIVVIAHNIGHSGISLGSGQHSAYDIGMALWPEVFPLEPPAINDIAHQKQIGAGVVFEKVTQEIGLAAAASEMHIADENGLVMHDDS